MGDPTNVSYPRIEFVQGNYYHIYNRDAGRQSIFRQEKGYVKLPWLMKDLMVKIDEQYRT